MQVVFTVNGPGEVSGWLHPLTAELRARYPEIRIVVCALPCVFSTGAETRVIAALDTVDAVFGVRDGLALILRGRGARALRDHGPTLVFHLGGEIALSALLSWRLKAARYAYVEHPAPLLRLFSKVFYNGLAPRPGESAGGTVGELMVDATRLRRAAAAAGNGASKTGPTVALFPGSRAFLAIHALPYFAVVVDRIAALRPEVDWVLARAAYVPLDTLRDFPPPLEPRRWDAVALRYGEEDGAAWLETEGGTRIRILDGARAVAEADFALTIPGTNTGELAAGGVPMVVATPTYLGHEVPLPGIPGHIARLPLIGRALKLAFGWARVRRLGLMAQPNVRSGEMLVPELLGEGLHPAMQSALEGLLDGYGADKVLRDRLRATMGAPGAAKALAEEIGRFFATPAAAQAPEVKA